MFTEDFKASGREARIRKLNILLQQEINNISQKNTLKGQGEHQGLLNKLLDEIEREFYEFEQNNILVVTKDNDPEEEKRKEFLIKQINRRTKIIESLKQRVHALFEQHNQKVFDELKRDLEAHIRFIEKMSEWYSKKQTYLRIEHIKHTIPYQHINRNIMLLETIETEISRYVGTEQDPFAQEHTIPVEEFKNKIKSYQITNIISYIENFIDRHEEAYFKDESPKLKIIAMDNNANVSPEIVRQAKNKRKAIINNIIKIQQVINQTQESSKNPTLLHDSIEELENFLQQYCGIIKRMYLGYGLQEHLVTRAWSERL